MRPHPRPTKPALAMALLVLLALMGMGGRSSGQFATDLPAVHEADPLDWRWAVTQGGLTLVVLVLVWSYRKDMSRWSDDRVEAEHEIEAHKRAAIDEKIAFQQARIDEAIRYQRQLEALIGRMEAVLTSTADAIAAHSTVLARNTDASHRLSNSVDKLETRLELIERRRQ